MEPQVIVMLGAFATAIVFAIGIPLTRAYSKKIGADPKYQGIPPAVTTRLDRIEQAVEAIAVEVERISEGQRFTTKLLSEGKSVPDSRQIASTGTPERDRTT